MITGAIIGALLAAGIAITIYHNAASFLGYLLPVIGIAMVGAALGAVVGAVSVSEREDERCPEGMVYVVSTLNSAGARGCVPFELLPEIGEG